MAIARDPNVEKPHAAHGHRLRVAVFAGLLGAITAFAAVSPVAAWSSGTYSLSDEQLLFTLTNQARASAGLNALRNDSYLVSIARWRSRDMAVNNYFSHNIPSLGGKMVFAKFDRDGYCYKVAGENIGRSSFPDDVATTRIHNAFMGSSSHRANILGNWKNMGIGTYKTADGTKFYTELFSMPCSTATPKPTPTPTPKATPRPTPKPTAPTLVTPRPTPRPAATRLPTAASTPAATATPTTSPVPTTSPLAPPPTAQPSPPPVPAALPSETHGALEPPAAVPPPAAQSLRVRRPAQADGLVESLFRSLFGAFFGQ